MAGGENKQDGNVGNLGDILKHAMLVQLAKIYQQHVSQPHYYLDSHSYLYQARLADSNWYKNTEQLSARSSLYREYIDIESPYIKRGDYLCSSGLVNTILPEAHLLLCETNKTTREWLLQQLADNRVKYHTVRQQMSKWVERKSFKKLPSLLALIDPFDLTDNLWRSVNRCLQKMLVPDAPFIMLVFDYKMEQHRYWPESRNNWLNRIGSISISPFHLAVYSSSELELPVRQLLQKMNWVVEVGKPGIN